MAADDQFCTDCGRPRLSVTAAQLASGPQIPPGPQLASGPQLPPGLQLAAEPQLPSDPRPPVGSHFGHAPPRPPGPMTNATRYLCAAAYLAPWFATGVIGAVVASHRAVAPSRDIDLEPVIRHCLKARRMQLVRNIAVCVLLLVGLVTAFVPLILIVVAAFLLSFLPGARWERKSVGRQVLAGATVALLAVGVAVVIGVIIVFLLLRHFLSGISSLSGSSGGAVTSATGGGLLAIVGLWGLLYACLFAATLLRYSYVRYRTLGQWLAPGAAAPAFPRSTERVEARIAQVRGAQYGNLMLYGGEDPFLGAGITPFTYRRKDERAWSIAIELKREGAPRGLFDAEERGQVRIDPVELHDVLRTRLEQLNDGGLPQNERVHDLVVGRQIVGEGQFRWDGPLVDPVARIPYSLVGDPAIDALIRSPQAGLRCYQLVSVRDVGQPVSAWGAPVIDGVDQEVIVSAFIYVAVEGHMFYLQFVPATLAPVLDRFRSIDRLPKLSSGKFLTKVAIEAAGSAFGDIIGAPGGVIGTCRQMWRESRSFVKEHAHADDYVYADLGALISVRELGASLLPRTYIQRLDNTKYTQIIERLVIETTLDFLIDRGADTGAYRQSAQAVYNAGVIVAGSNNAVAVSTGGGATTATTGASTGT